MKHQCPICRRPTDSDQRRRFSFLQRALPPAGPRQLGLGALRGLRADLRRGRGRVWPAAFTPASIRVTLTRMNPSTEASPQAAAGAGHCDQPGSRLPAEGPRHLGLAGRHLDLRPDAALFSAAGGFRAEPALSAVTAMRVAGDAGWPLAASGRRTAPRISPAKGPPVRGDRRGLRPASHLRSGACAAELEIFAPGIYTFSRLRYLEAISRAASRIPARRPGHHGGRLGRRPVRRAGALVCPALGHVKPSAEKSKPEVTQNIGKQIETAHRTNHARRRHSRRRNPHRRQRICGQRRLPARA